MEQEDPVRSRLRRRGSRQRARHAMEQEDPVRSRFRRRGSRQRARHAMEQEDLVRSRLWRPESMWWMILDQRGFHIHLDAVGVVGPVSSLSDAWHAAETELAREANDRPGLSRTHRLYEEGDQIHDAAFSTSGWQIYDDYFRPPDAPEHAPRRSWDWEYHLTLSGGLFYVHTPDAGLGRGLLYVPPPDAARPFHTLSEANTAIRSHRSWAAGVSKLRTTNEYYFTLKDGRFRVYPDVVGGSFKFLADATDAVARHRAWELEQEEKDRQIDIFMAQADPAVYIPQMEELLELIRSGKSEPPKPVKKSWLEELLDSLGPDTCDLAILQEADRFDRIEAEEESIKNGMKWMESEVLRAFEIYKRSSCYQGPKYEFVKLDHQCLIHDACSKSYHHYNFTMKKKSSFYLRKKRGKRSWDYQLFFAEVKTTKEGKEIICCPLQHGDNGHCFGCQNVGINLIHPTNGGYEKGHEGSGFPFDSDYES